MRVLLAGVSNLLSNIVTAALSGAPDIVVAGSISNVTDLASEIRSTRADAVIVQAKSPSAAADFTELLYAFPALKVVAFDSVGNRGALYQLRPYSQRFTGVSVDTLLSALRAPNSPNSPIRRVMGR